MSTSPVDSRSAAPPGATADEPTPPRSGRRAVEAAIVSASQIGGLGFVFLNGVVTARLFSPDLRGEYGLFVTAVAFAGIFTTFGLPEAIVYFHRRGEAERERVATSIALAVLASALLLLLTLPLATWFAESYFPTGGVPLVGAVLVGGAASVLLRTATAFLQARHRFLASGLCNLLRPAVFSLLLLWVWLGALDLLATGWLYAASFALAAATAFAPLARRIRPSSLDRPYLGKLLRFSVKSYAQAIVNQLNYRIDIFVVAFLVSDLADVAFYHVAAGLAGMLWIVPDSYGQVIYPRMASYRDERSRSRETVAGLRYVFALVSVGAIALGVAAPLLVPLVFGAAYAAATPVLVALLPGVVAMALCKILTRYLVSRNRHQVNSLWMLVAVAIDVAANFALIPRIGILGASVAASLAYTTMAAGLFAAFLSAADLRRDDWREFPRRELALARDTLRTARVRLRGGA